MNKLKKKITWWLTSLICASLQIGGWCGLCGSWIDDELFPVRWPFGICRKCLDASKTETETGIGSNMTDCEVVGINGDCGPVCLLFLIGECDAHWLNE